MRTVTLGSGESAIVFRNEPGQVELAIEEDDMSMNALLVQALFQRCTEDPAFVDAQLNWVLSQQETINDQPL